MAARSILEWLRRRRAVATGLTRFVVGHAASRARGQFGLAVRPPRRPLLLAAPDWRERMAAIREQSALTEHSPEFGTAHEPFARPATDAIEADAPFVPSVSTGRDASHANEAGPSELARHTSRQAAQPPDQAPRRIDDGPPIASDTVQQPDRAPSHSPAERRASAPNTPGTAARGAPRADTEIETPLNKAASTDRQPTPNPSATRATPPQALNDDSTPAPSRQPTETVGSEPPRATSRTRSYVPERAPIAPSSEPRETAGPRATERESAGAGAISSLARPGLIDPAESLITQPGLPSVAPPSRSEDQPPQGDVSRAPAGGRVETAASRSLASTERGLPPSQVPSFESTRAPAIESDHGTPPATSPPATSSAEATRPRVPVESPRDSGADPRDREQPFVAEAATSLRVESPQPGSGRASAPASPPPNEERRARRPLPAPPSDHIGQTFNATEPRESDPTSGSETIDEPASSDPVAADAPTAERPLAEWRRLLFEATSAQPEARPPQVADNTPARSARGAAPPPAAPLPAEPLLESTRKFLQPRVGIDPATVPIVRSVVADRVLDKLGADAAAFGEAVALPTTADERSPAVRGVLAHELTHVAQRRSPRFVPPAVKPKASTESEERTPRLEQRAFSEERLALDVERAVMRDATGAGEPGAFSTPTPGTWTAESPTDLGSVAPSGAASRAWGNLPAPWEPLPYISDSPGLPGAAFSAAPAAATDAPVHLAEHGRALDEPEAAPAAHAHAADAAPTPPAPDIDVLARKVYDVLKRRLAAERRREG